MNNNRFLFLLISFFFLLSVHAQIDTRKRLEQRRLELQREIHKINQHLVAAKHSESTALIEYEQLKTKINIRKKLIRNLRGEINHINRQIIKTQKQITQLDKELNLLKKNYAEMIRQSYNSRSRNNKLYFLFSSEGLQQAFKRMQYLKQYAGYRREQGVKIQEKRKELSVLKTNLEKDKASKKALFKDYQKEAAQIEKERQKQLQIVNKIKRKKNYYLSQIKKKQQEQAKIDKMIDALIRKAIVKSNKKHHKRSKKKTQFFLTPEGQKLSNKFSANRGVLPWPVKKAYISRKFGVQQHPIFKNVKLENNGIFLATEKGSTARAVFEGKVLQIQLIPGGNNTVFIKHGDYLTIYGNLSKVFVKPGETVKTKQEIGKIATDSNTGKTELKFRIYKNLNKLDPEKWLYKK